MVQEAMRKALFNMRTWAEKMPEGSPEETTETRYHMLRQWSVGSRTPLAENCDRMAQALERHRDDVDEAIRQLREVGAGRRGG